MLKRKSDQLIFVYIIGILTGLCFTFFTEDFRARAEAGEAMTCRDEPDRAAWMGRRPGEAHSVEACIKVPRYGDPAWVPYFQHPLGPPRNHG